MQKSASIQPRTSLSKFGGKFNSSFIRLRRQHAVEILRHVNALDDYARTTQGLMKNVLAAKDGTKEEKRASMVALVDGVKSIAVGVHANLAALRFASS